MTADTPLGTLHSELNRPAMSLFVRWLLWLFFVALALLAIAMVAASLFALRWWTEERAAAAAVQAHVARIRFGGEPITVEDLYRFHALPPGTVDSTPAWQAAISAAQSIGAVGLPYVGSGDKASLSPSVANSQLRAAEQFLTDNRGALEQIRAVSRQGGECRLPYAFEKGFAGIPSEANGVRACLRLLALDVHVQAVRGNADAALASLADMLAAADTLSREPTSMEQLSRLGTLSSALGQVELLLNELALTDDQLVGLSRLLQTCDLQGRFTHSLIGERAMAFNAFQQPGGMLPRSVDCGAYLEILTEIIDCSRQPLPAGRQQMLTAIDKFQAQQQQARSWDRGQKALTAQILPSQVTIFDAFVKWVAYRDALLVAVAAERHRLKSGEFPARPDVLVPAQLSAVPLDPFDGQPLRYRRLESEIAVYSVGVNGRDDRAANAPGNSGEPDIVVRLRAMKESSHD